MNPHADVEHRMLALISDADLPEPDLVEHWEASVAFFWHDVKVVVVVDLFEAPLERDELLELVPPGMAGAESRSQCRDNQHAAEPR